MIPERYLLREKPSREYRQRTEWNVRDSDATVIFTVSQEVTGGSKLTAELAAKHGKPWLHLAREVPGDPVARLREFLAAHSVKVLNVAGSRASMAVPGEALSMPSHQRARSTAGWLHAAVSQAWLRSCALHSP